VDRQVLAALLPYIKEEYNLSDTQLGMLVSIVNISIATLVVPTGYLVDRWSRKKMMAIMVFVWSLATAACGLAQNFTSLFMARFFVGAGEAGYAPASQSLMAASFPGRMRTFVLSVNSFGSAAGAPLGLVAGALIAQHWGWRYAFGIVALPGILGAALCFWLKDFKNVTPRDKAEAESAMPLETPQGTALRNKESFWLTFKGFVAMPTTLLVCIAQACNLMLAATVMNWLPTYFNRAAGMSPTSASGIAAGFLLFSAVSVLFMSTFLDALRRRRRTLAMQGMALGCFLAFVILCSAFTMFPAASLMQLGLLFLSAPLAIALPSLGYTIIADLTPHHRRGTSISLLVVSQNLLGMAVGPLLTGILSDKFDLGISLAIMTGMHAIAGLLYIVISKTYDRDLAKVERFEVAFE
jgi:MFS family permease